METKHTPGPWVKDYGNTIGHIKSIAKHEDRATPTLCRYDTEYIASSIPEEEREANGKLIAAAPDLLSSLIECLAGVKELNGEYQDGWSDIITRAEAAIIKATP